MQKRWGLVLAGSAAAGLLAVAAVAPDGAAAQAAPAEPPQEAREDAYRLEQKLRARLAEMQDRLTRQETERLARVSQELEERLAARARRAQFAARDFAEEMQAAAALAADAAQEVVFAQADGSGWLGVSIREVTAEKVAELKLPAERGVLIAEVEPESPAAKAGLRASDVISEYNSQRVEGTAQFRRLVRETPEGRAVQLTVWREGRAQTITATLGSRREQLESRIRVMPRIARTPEMHVPTPDSRVFGMFISGAPTLGIHAEEVSGQLGEYFGAPDGEGILVREVRSGSPAEKAGMKAGDLITRVAGERVKTLGELRSKLREKREEKALAVTVLRRGQEVPLHVELEQPERPAPRPGRRVRL